MKILWVNPNFLHPTTKGGQIRTLEIVRRLHRRHEIHYVALDNGKNPEGPARAHEYSTYAYPVKHRIPPKRSFEFFVQLVQNIFSRLPLAVSRYHCRALERTIADLLARHRFESIVCDFLFPAPNFDDLSRCVLFQHNVESIIWKRHFETARDPARRMLFKAQAHRMLRFEAEVCREVRHVIAVSDIDARRMTEMFGITEVSATATGVDAAHFTPPHEMPKTTDLVFVGSMDWMANIDGVNWFVDAIFPLIRSRRPDCTMAVVGRSPAPPIVALGQRDPAIKVTGTVPDVRPYFWQSQVCIVPLRVGGGTRLKIFEAMAAGIPVVATTIGAEGLPLADGQDILIADEPESFAEACLRLLADADLRRRIATSAYQLVAERFSWDSVADHFEDILRAHPAQ